MEELNGQPAIVGYLDGRVYGVALLEITGDRVHHVYMVLNPDKLARLGTGLPSRDLTP